MKRYLIEQLGETLQNINTKADIEKIIIELKKKRA